MNGRDRACGSHGVPHVMFFWALLGQLVSVCQKMEGVGACVGDVKHGVSVPVC